MFCTRSVGHTGRSPANGPTSCRGAVDVIFARQGAAPDVSTLNTPAKVPNPAVRSNYYAHLCVPTVGQSTTSKEVVYRYVRQYKDILSCQTVSKVSYLDGLCVLNICARFNVVEGGEDMFV
ncbi:hypothetical protein QE152_g21661 [Popillia japonica]|uniref:Uncharacterized protein n=1 Tax=Popillia japonica TaxID=7064 RepID=A0AAW1KMV5_POPJA